MGAVATTYLLSKLQRGCREVAKLQGGRRSASAAMASQRRCRLIHKAPGRLPCMRGRQLK